MSWDIIIMNFPADAKSTSEIPQDYQPKPLGPRQDVINRIHELLSGVDFSDPSWGIFVGVGFSIEFNTGRNEICDSLMLHLRGGGDAVDTVERLLQHLGLRAFDCQTGEFFSRVSAAESFAKWQNHRDRSIGKANA